MSIYLMLLSHGVIISIAEDQEAIHHHDHDRDILTIDDQINDDPYRTAYHFQPLQNWMNGMFNLSNI